MLGNVPAEYFEYFVQSRSGVLDFVPVRPETETPLYILGSSADIVKVLAYGSHSGFPL